jgi:hypothetical protein
MKTKTKKSNRNIKLPLVMRDISNKLDHIISGIDLLLQRRASNEPEWRPPTYKPSSHGAALASRSSEDLEVLAFGFRAEEAEAQMYPTKDPQLGTL